MGTPVIVHITAGSVALASGYVALFATKGASLHRRIGMVFVYAMLTMCTMGLILAIAHNAAPGINVPAALITGSMVITGLTTVRPASPLTRRFDLFATLMTFSVGL